MDSSGSLSLLYKCQPTGVKCLNRAKFSLIFSQIVLSEKKNESKYWPRGHFFAFFGGKYNFGQILISEKLLFEEMLFPESLFPKL